MQTVVEYIAAFPAHVQEKLTQIRNIIKHHAPQADERISYGMPGYYLHNKPLVYFAAFSKHIGFYATPTGHAAFAEKLTGYKQGKGSVQFPLDKPLPEELIAEMVKFRIQESKDS
jgi:uncharacterized protein YdhG (YjbR/CyaY superfamily)